MLRLVLEERTDQTEEIVDMMAAEIVLEILGFLAAERVYAKADRIDEIAMVLDVVAPIGDAADVDRMSFALEEAPQALTVVLGQVPIASPIVAVSSRVAPASGPSA